LADKRVEILCAFHGEATQDDSPVLDNQPVEGRAILGHPLLGIRETGKSSGARLDEERRCALFQEPHLDTIVEFRSGVDTWRCIHDALS
jgi:hypothetical protein